MKKSMRILSVCLLLAMVLSLVPGASAAASRNDGVRHQVCEELSEQANAYYQAEGITYDDLAALAGDGSGSGLSAVDSELYAALHDLMESTMTNSVTYSALTSYWPTTDSVAGSSDAVLFYSDFVAGGYNREHVWPKSRGSFYQSGAGSDLHHLRPTNTNVNATRSNYTMGNVRGVIDGYSTYQNGGKDVLYYSSANDLVEINDNIKGDVARIFLYVYVRWEEPNLFENDPDPKQGSNDTGGNNGLKVIESLDTLLSWCEMDPVDDWEMQRNDMCQNVQGNRNVFIDYPELAWELFELEAPADMQTPSGKAQEGGVSYTVAVEDADPVQGTVSLSGRTVTAVPMEGWMVSGAVVAPEGAATLTRNGNTFRLSDITADCTVTVTFAEKTAARVSFVIPEGVSVEAPKNVYVGDPIALPQVSGEVVDHTFLGWALDTVADTTDKGSFNLYPAGSEYILTESATDFYAVYSYQVSGGSGATDTFNLVTEAPADWTGDYVFTGTIASSGENYALLADGSQTGTDIGSANAAKTFAAAGITKNGDTLENVPQGYVIHMEKISEGVYAFQLKNAGSPVYLAYTGSRNTMTTDTSGTAASAQWKIVLGADGATITNVGTSSRIMGFNASAKMFRCYTSAQNPIILYGAGAGSETHYLTLGEKPVCPHANTTTVTVKPTCAKDGSVTVTCDDCGETVSITVLPAEGIGLAKDADGNYFYYQDGSVLTDYTGLVPNSFGNWYVVNGQVRFDFNSLNDGLVEFEGKLYEIRGGRVNTDKTGLVKRDGAWYYVAEGVVDAAYTGLAKSGTFTYYVENGTLNFKLTDVVEVEGVKYFVKYGNVATGYTGLVKGSDGVWRYVAEGVFDATYTGTAKGNDGVTFYYVQNGLIDFKFSGTIVENGTEFTVKNGVVIAE